MFKKLITEFNTARKNGIVDTTTKQQKFVFSFPELGIENVNMLLHKEALNKRYKVNVIMNLDDRRSMIFPDEDIDRARAIIGVCAPIAKYDTQGHMKREQLRKEAIETVRKEIRETHFNEALENTNAPDEIRKELAAQINSKMAPSTYRFIEELRNNPINFNDIRSLDSFTYVLYASICMITEHFEKEVQGKNLKVKQLPAQYYFYYVDSKAADKLPAHIGSVKKMLHNTYKYYGNYRFYQFCDWLANLFAKIPGHDREIMTTLEQQRFDERREKLKVRMENKDKKFTNTERKPFNKPAKKWDDFAGKSKAPIKSNKPMKKNTAPAANNFMTMGDILGDVLDEAVGKGE